MTKIARAKNQRIDLLRRHFWYVVTNSLHQIDWVRFLDDIRQFPDLALLTEYIKRGPAPSN